MAAGFSDCKSLLCTDVPPSRPNKHNLPLPTTCHVALDDKFLAGRKVFVIGDVHGCYDEMCELMQLAANKEENLLFIFVGDLVNKGPKSVEVIRKLRAMDGNALSVRGNHEESVLREVRSCAESEDYELPDKYRWMRGLSVPDIEYIKELPYTISIPSLKTLIVHAGIIPNQPLEEHNLYNFTHMRNIVVEGDSDSPVLEATSNVDRGKPWASYWSGPEHVYYGHHARLGFQSREFSTGLDTGCVYGKDLTGIFADGSKTTLQVPYKAEI